MQEYSSTVTQRFLNYVQIDTQSDPSSKTVPSTLKQKDLSALLVEELKVMGVNAELDSYGYVYATIPANTEKKVPVICFCAHVDTSPDSSGNGVKPIVHYNYDGSDIVLPDDTTQVITAEQHPYLQQKIGEDIITASGTTLLGADDKSGVAIIMDLAHYLQHHPQVKHGTIKILFTPDEEIGRGVDFVDIQKLGADFGYTLDGGMCGALEDETFSADALTVKFFGVAAHPGYAKGKLVNAVKVASFFIDALPTAALSPETTAGREGFVHPVRLSGTAEEAYVDFILRDFITTRLSEYAFLLQQKVNEALDHFPGARAEITTTEQYRNMKDVLIEHPEVSQYAAEAMQRAGIAPLMGSARGGTDGSRLSFMGLPCPNIFTGEMAFHSKHEYVSVQDMQKAVETLVHLVQIWEEKA